jgi:Putative capsular polysaccharide synthesis protein
MKTKASHITPDHKAWIVQRKISDAVKRILWRLKKWVQGRLFWIKHPQQARHTRNNIFLVYTMGKVASMSVFNTLLKRLPHVPVFAMHYVSEKNLAQQEQLLKDSLYKKMHRIHAAKIKHCINRHPQREIKIITIVREPLAQIISQVFQQLSLFDLDDLRSLSPDNKQLDFDYPGNWCEDELRAFSGIDILKQKFVPEKGYEIYKHNKFSVLLIRFEDLKRVFATAMNEFTGIGAWELESKNLSENKDYSRKYQYFKNEVRIDPDVFSHVYTSGFAKQFYSEKDIAEFKNRWRKGNNKK